MNVQVQVVQSSDEAYELLKVSSEDFTQRLFPEEVAAREAGGTGQRRFKSGTT